MKLKPCPFCNRKNPKMVSFHSCYYSVVCKCGAESPKHSTSKQGAQRIWNRRRYTDLEVLRIKEQMHQEYTQPFEDYKKTIK